MDLNLDQNYYLSENYYLAELIFRDEGKYATCSTPQLVYICNWIGKNALVRIASKGYLTHVDYYQLFVGTSVEDVKSKIEQYAKCKVEFKDCE